MDQLGSLQGIFLALVLHETAGHVMQLSVHVFRELIQRCLVTMAPGSQQICDAGRVWRRFTHSPPPQKVITVMSGSALLFRLYGWKGATHEAHRERMYSQ
jgi:hypothetical protein